MTEWDRAKFLYFISKAPPKSPLFPYLDTSWTLDKSIVSSVFMNKINLWPEPISQTDGFVTLSAVIELPNQSRFRLWYRLAEEYLDSIATNSDHFAIAAIFLAMRRGLDVRVHGEVSPSLLSNIEEFQSIWSCWRPGKYKIAQISAATEREYLSADKEDRAISCFSGGVDSCFSVWRHKNGTCGRRQRNLQAGLMIHGFDIPLKDSAFEGASRNVSKTLSSVAIKTISIQTNFREIVTYKWNEVFGTGLASCLHLLKNGYSVGIIPSSHSYSVQNFIYGSNPLSDRLLSSKSFEIEHDGAQYPRIEKLRAILAWPEAMENLRICWQGKERDRNCGRCEKCIRNILNLRILRTPLPPSFMQDATDSQIAGIVLKDSSIEIWETLLKNAQAHSVMEPWVESLETAIRRNRVLSGVRSHLPMARVELIKEVLRAAKAKWL